ncbi:hypothetical protein [Caryophanon latum]|uniref:DUF3990 domain-containing protein n=1 Tax=Caryophanon latum TaxID=33977 RepID=A0A1C0YJE7_9BACL|nr:hypothetical protein [Caryophanon latum]OCS87305.1 hypothetical protein A6K76_02745 [Caryophanon latum]
MVTLTLYHATNKERGNEIQHSRLFPVTKGDHHWLGDGSYFFLEAFHAYKWMLDMYKYRFSHIIKYDELQENYKIIETTIEIPDQRIFNLMLAEHKIIFDETYKSILSVNPKVLYRAPEGKVINYLFQSLGLNNDYDCVLGLFGFNYKNYEGTKSRIAFMPQLQLCIKDDKLLQQHFNDFDYTNQIEMYNYLLSKYYFEKVKKG